MSDSGESHESLKPPESHEGTSSGEGNDTPAQDKRLKWEDFFSPPKPDDVKDYIQKDVPTPQEVAKRVYAPKTEELSKTPSNGDVPNSGYMSFGDEGTTAIITDWGQQVQISRCLGHGSSSIYAIDYNETSEPFRAKGRDRDLLGLIEDHRGFGPDFICPGDDFQVTTWWLRNRWPRVIFREEGKWELVQQWVIRNGVVIAQLVLNNLKDEELKLWYQTNLYILVRELDFVNSAHSFNKGEDAGSVIEGAGPGGYGFVRIQRLSERAEAHLQDGESPGQGTQPDAVAAVMGFFVNGQAVTKQDLENDQYDNIIPVGGSFQLVVGYKLVLLTRQSNDWRPLVLKAEDVDIDRFLAPEWLGPDPLADESLFKREYYIRRNVAHILSVCMIPVPQGPVWDYPEPDGQGGEKEEEEESVALTCGDMAGHRICVSASFFAFKYLVDLAGTLKSDPPLKLRIRKKCFAHLRWVFITAERIQKADFARNYWINGKIPPGGPQLHSDGPTDTPFQILKAYVYYKGLATETDREQIRKWLGDPENDGLAARWVEALDKRSKRNAFVWSHSQRAGMDYFRLDDNVWIINAIAAVWEILDWDKRVKRPKTSSRSTVNEDKEQQKRAGLARKYEPNKLRREILQRFTTVNDDVKQRMLAVTRSPRETRFALHGRDTALFYTMVVPVLDKEDQRWLNTMQVQKRFSINQDGDSDNSLRHGLSMLIAREGVSMSRLDPPAMAKDAKKAALETMMPANGLFPGSINDDFEHTAHISSEMPLILLAQERIEAIKEKASKQDNRGNNNQPDIPDQTPIEIPKEEPSKQDIKGNKSPPDEDPARNMSVLDGTLPFSDQIDVKNIIDVKEEWLYNYPVFLGWEIPQQSLSPLSMLLISLGTSIGEFLREPSGSVEGVDGAESNLANEEHGEVISEAARPCRQSFYRPLEILPLDCEIVLIDVGEKPSRTKKTPNLENRVKRFNNVMECWNRLNVLRDADMGKKRVLCCQNPTLDHALMCYLATPESEQSSISSFFNRHASCTTFFEDRTSRVRNTWETEFHCSFLVLNKDKPLHLLDEDKPLHLLERPVEAPLRLSKLKGDSEPSQQPTSVKISARLKDKGKDNEKEGEKTENDRARPILNQSILQPPKLSPNQPLLRASAGFRLQGDFFNRFWTCHYVESVPNRKLKTSMNAYLDKPYLEKLFKDGSEHVWQQRKVLELLLFYRIIEESNQNTRIIIREVQYQLNKNSPRRRKDAESSPANYDSKEYFNSLSTWASLHKILEYLEVDLERTLGNVNSWNSREQDRRTEQPRWTNKAEKKYRDAINTALVLCHRAERNLKTHRSRVTFLSKKLSYDRDEARNEYEGEMSEQSFRQNENVKYFTYSTVFFLPLGFASSIYTMQAAPPTDVVQHMVICAIVAFVVLGVAIATLPEIMKGVKWIWSNRDDLDNQLMLKWIQHQIKHPFDDSGFAKAIKGLRRGLHEWTEKMREIPRRSKNPDSGSTETIKSSGRDVEQGHGDEGEISQRSKNPDSAV
ncbi:hypothetical protein BO78DRAFT_433482 [Aspergillus sclerotiicarbonarius CBS 121057]|uniref:Uncharacterized protein n=1 Tax=Aspergillus sclerotiicarbonarius (strain CBS 121057 / IBT 28362) TaxID=1448318 RepID=A0A319DZY6_ASPSB|nr:hypothetical protein BO78DRAFT_433482 [Aspergillus sclerotiicarbonarius CBS 121057]